MESQTMTMEYTEGGAEITSTIHIDQNQDLVSMSVERTTVCDLITNV